MTQRLSVPINMPQALKKDVDDQALGRSAGGLSTKIHVLCDALGNPTGVHLTGGNAHNLTGADVLLPGLKAQALLADRAYHAQKRVIQPLEAKGITIVIPPKRNHKNPRPYDKDLYKAHHLIENFFCKLKRFRSIATRYDKTRRNFLAAVYAAAVVILAN